MYPDSLIHYSQGKREGLDIEIDLWQIKQEELDRKTQASGGANAD